jgi:hypothetical protein
MRNAKLLKGLVASGALLLAAACNETRDTGAVTTTTNEGTSTTPTAETVEERDNALVRVVNAIPNQTTSIYAGDSLAFADVAYKSVTEFKEMPDDYFGFRVVKPGANVKDNTLAENREKLSNGGHYTIVAIADNDDDADSFGELRVLDDELKPITNGKARVRFVNAVAGLDDEISVYPRGSENALVDGVNFKMEAGWNEEDPWAGTLEVRTEDRKSPLATVPNVDLKAGGTYTFVIAGTPNKVEVIQIKDQVARDPDADNAMPDNRTEKSPAN